MYNKKGDSIYEKAHGGSCSLLYVDMRSFVRRRKKGKLSGGLVGG
jgi:hypothetical protein